MFQNLFPPFATGIILGSFPLEARFMPRHTSFLVKPLTVVLRIEVHSNSKLTDFDCAASDWRGILGLTAGNERSGREQRLVVEQQIRNRFRWSEPVPWFCGGAFPVALHTGPCPFPGQCERDLVPCRTALLASESASILVSKIIRLVGDFRILRESAAIVSDQGPIGRSASRRGPGSLYCPRSSSAGRWCR